MAEAAKAAAFDDGAKAAAEAEAGKARAMEAAAKAKARAEEEFARKEVMAHPKLLCTPPVNTYCLLLTIHYLPLARLCYTPPQRLRCTPPTKAPLCGWCCRVLAFYSTCSRWPNSEWLDSSAVWTSTSTLRTKHA